MTKFEVIEITPTKVKGFSIVKFNLDGHEGQFECRNFGETNFQLGTVEYFRLLTHSEYTSLIDYIFESSEDHETPNDEVDEIQSTSNRPVSYDETLDNN